MRFRKRNSQAATGPVRSLAIICRAAISLQDGRSARHGNIEDATNAVQEILETFIFWKYSESMGALANTIVEAGWQDRLITDKTLIGLLGPGDARRYGLVNRALKDGSLVRLKRGLYTLSDKYRTTPPHPYSIAQALRPGSYISFETALSYHGFIPEAVYEIASVGPGRKSFEIDHLRFGAYSFSPVAVNPYQFLMGVDRLAFEGSGTALIASPLRSLMDMVAVRRTEWQGLSWLTDGLRIEEAALVSFTRKNFKSLSGVYKYQVAKDFLASLEEAVFAMKTTSEMDLLRKSGERFLAFERRCYDWSEPRLYG